MKEQRTLFLKATSSEGVSVSDLPMTGMTLTRGERRLISSISNSRNLHRNEIFQSILNEMD